VNALRAMAAPFGVAAAVGLSGCLTSTSRNAQPPPAPVLAPSTPAPAGSQAGSDVVPRAEPRSRYGNPPFYEVFGKRYYVLSSSTAYVERGVASWYGPGFHKIRTSTGEQYDMYGMTAAHKTLPLPAYVRVTNLQNGRSVTVRVNDRGPFVGNRIIDLSYTAAARLDMLRNGTAMVEVRSVEPAVQSRDPVPTLVAAAPMTPSSGASGAAMANGAPAPAAVPTLAAATTASAAPANAIKTALFVQAGAFADPANAERLAGRLRGGGYGTIFVRDDLIAGRKMYRVRIGPVAGVPEFDRIVSALERAGVHDAHLAMD